MAFERRWVAGFTLGLAWRIAALAAALAIFVWALLHSGLAATRVVAALLVAAAAAALWRHVTRTNRELTRFIHALRLGDLSQSFSHAVGGSFDALGQAMDEAVRALRVTRGAVDEQARVQIALLDESPAALLMVDEELRISLANKAARRLFALHAGTRVEDFAPYGSDLAALLTEERPGRRLIRLNRNGVIQRATASRGELDHGGRRLAVIAVQPIQNELSAVELAAQADLVRVLTHEIMNSMTPVVSLAQSSAALMEDIVCGDEKFVDARMAVETLAHRAGGIMRFVESYRAFAREPEVHRRRFMVKPWAEELARLFAASAEGGGSLEIAVTPADLMLYADPDLIAQVVLNLLKNGAEAARPVNAPCLTLSAELLPGAYTRLVVSDNGPGIAPHLAEEIFLPFFTTKASGTGVGLSLARRILTAHGGTIALAAPRSTPGAAFELIL